MAGPGLPQPGGLSDLAERGHRLAGVPLHQATTVNCIHCDQEGVRDVNGRGTLYCEAHYRLSRMRRSAKAGGKFVPGIAELEALVPDPLVCSECDLEMFWRSNVAGMSAVVSLQHWKDGTVSLICQSCNARMTHSEDVPPEGHRRCFKCCAVKLLAEFTTRGYICKTCRSEYDKQRRSK
jgi:hypothetical protein